jgi:hypothetical protein
MTPMKGLKKTIIKKYGSALNLISEQHSTVFLTGIPFLSDTELEENSENLPVLVLKMDPGWRAEPGEPPSAGNLVWFPGGNYLDMELADGLHIEVEIFDRQETPELYALLSS